MGKPKFLVVELMSRLRATSDMIKYPACIYEGDSAAVVSEATSTVEVALQADEENQDESNTGAADEVVVEDDSDDECIDDDHIEDGIPREAMDIFFADDVVNLCDDDDDITHGDVDATPQQIQHATDTNLNQMSQMSYQKDRMRSAYLQISSTSWIVQSYQCTMSIRLCSLEAFELPCLLCAKQMLMM